MEPNPFREKASRARALADKLNSPSASEAAMAGSFPYGGGYGRRGADKRLERRVDRALKAVEATKNANRMETLADMFDAGKVNERGRSIRPKSTAKPRKEGPRLFSGVFPGGISYSDCFVEVSGDYKRLAFLPFGSLVLEWRVTRIDPALRAEIEADAARIIAMRGQPFQTSATGQTVTLGR